MAERSSFVWSIAHERCHSGLNRRSPHIHGDTHSSVHVIPVAALLHRFVLRDWLGDAAVAGVSAALLITLAPIQVLGVGTVASISHAVGRKNQKDANLIFNHPLLIAATFGALALLLGYTLSVPY